MKTLYSSLAAGVAGMLLVPLVASAASMQTGMMMKADAGVMVGGAMMTPDRDIVDNAVRASNVTTVVAAVKAAGLVDTLKGAGPFTVFAPTNYAFSILPKGTVENLLKPENKDKLTSILTYHVVAGAYKWNDLKNGMTLTTVNGALLHIKKVGNAVWINNARIQVTNVVSSNGVTHVINRVLMPPAADAKMMDAKMMKADAGVMVGGALMVKQNNIVENAVMASNVTTLVAAVKAAGLVPTLSGKGPFTVFAPTNDAFAKLPAGTVEMLLKPENKAKLTSILTYHVVAGRYTAASLKDGMTLKTVEGEMLTVRMKNGAWWINDAMVQIPDVISSNGVTFVIDSVLMPPMAQ